MSILTNIELNKKIIFRGKAKGDEYKPSCQVEGELVVKKNAFFNFSMKALRDSKSSLESIEIQITTSSLVVKYDYTYFYSDGTKQNTHFEYIDDDPNSAVPESWEDEYLSYECYPDSSEDLCSKKREFLKRFQNNQLAVSEVKEMMRDLIYSFLSNDNVSNRVLDFVEMTDEITEVEVKDATEE